MSFPELRKFPYFAFDTEDTGLQYPVDRVFGFSISTPDGRDYYWDIRRQPQARDWLNEQISRYNGTIIMANASFDYRMSFMTGIRLPIDQLDDVIIRASLIDEHLPTYTLDYLAKAYLGAAKVDEIYGLLAQRFGGPATRKAQMKNLQHAEPEEVAPYAMGDSRLTLDLWEWQEQEIDRQSLHQVAMFERDLMPTFIRTEMAGIRVDLNYAEEAADRLTPLLEAKQAELNGIVGFDMNTNSSPQIKKFFDPQQLEDGTWVVGDTPIGTTDKGAPSLKAEYLREISHPAADLIMDIRSIIKTRDTFLRGHVLAHAHNDRVYPTVNQAQGETGGTGTGRLSYQRPAMQQIPSRNKAVAAIVKPCFLPDEGHVWVDVDENSFEVRIFAHLVNNPEILAAYAANPELDFHQFVAELTKLVRNATYSGQPNAKQLNLSMIFNSGNGAIADKMGMPWNWTSFTTKMGETVTYKKAGPEAEAVIAKYHRRIPGIKSLAERAAKKAKMRGYIHTFTGRHLRFPRGWKTYKASGILIQATAADQNKRNWKSIEEELDGEGRLILNTHDSYGMSLPEDNWQQSFTRVKTRLEHNPHIRVPLLLDLNGVGRNWWEALQGA